MAINAESALKKELAELLRQIDANPNYTVSEKRDKKRALIQHYAAKIGKTPDKFNSAYEKATQTTGEAFMSGLEDSTIGFVTNTIPNFFKKAAMSAGIIDENGMAIVDDVAEQYAQSYATTQAKIDGTYTNHNIANMLGSLAPDVLATFLSAGVGTVVKEGSEALMRTAAKGAFEGAAKHMLKNTATKIALETGSAVAKFSPKVLRAYTKFLPYKSALIGLAADPTHGFDTTDLRRGAAAYVGMKFATMSAGYAASQGAVKSFLIDTFYNTLGDTAQAIISPDIQTAGDYAENYIEGFIANTLFWGAKRIPSTLKYKVMEGELNKLPERLKNAKSSQEVTDLMTKHAFSIVDLVTDPEVSEKATDIMLNKYIEINNSLLASGNYSVSESRTIVGEMINSLAKYKAEVKRSKTEGVVKKIAANAASKFSETLGKEIDGMKLFDASAQIDRLQTAKEDIETGKAEQTGDINRIYNQEEYAKMNPTTTVMNEGAEKVKNKAEKVYENVKEKAGQVYDNVKETVKEQVERIMPKEDFEDIKEGVDTILNDSAKTIQEKVKAAEDFATDVINSTKGADTKLSESAKKTFNQTKEKLNKMVKSVKEKNYSDSAKEIFAHKIKETADKLYEMATNVGEKMSDTAKNFTENIKENVQETKETPKVNKNETDLPKQEKVKEEPINPKVEQEPANKKIEEKVVNEKKETEPIKEKSENQEVKKEKEKKVNPPEKKVSKTIKKTKEERQAIKEKAKEKADKFLKIVDEKLEGKHVDNYTKTRIANSIKDEQQRYADFTEEYHVKQEDVDTAKQYVDDAFDISKENVKDIAKKYERGEDGSLSDSRTLSNDLSNDDPVVRIVSNLIYKGLDSNDDAAKVFAVHEAKRILSKSIPHSVLSALKIIDKAVKNNKIPKDIAGHLFKELVARLDTALYYPSRLQKTSSQSKSKVEHWERYAKPSEALDREVKSEIKKELKKRNKRIKNSELEQRSKESLKAYSKIKKSIAKKFGAKLSRKEQAKLAAETYKAYDAFKVLATFSTSGLDETVAAAVGIATGDFKPLSEINLAIPSFLSSHKTQAADVLADKFKQLLAETIADGRNMPLEKILNDADLSLTQQIDIIKSIGTALSLSASVEEIKTNKREIVTTDTTLKNDVKNTFGRIVNKTKKASGEVKESYTKLASLQASVETGVKNVITAIDRYAVDNTFITPKSPSNKAIYNDYRDRKIAFRNKENAVLIDKPLAAIREAERVIDTFKDVDFNKNPIAKELVDKHLEKAQEAVDEIRKLSFGKKEEISNMRKKVKNAVKELQKLPTAGKLLHDSIRKEISEKINSNDYSFVKNDNYDKVIEYMAVTGDTDRANVKEMGKAAVLIAGARIVGKNADNRSYIKIDTVAIDKQGDNFIVIPVRMSNGGSAEKEFLSSLDKVSLDIYEKKTGASVLYDFNNNKVITGKATDTTGIIAVLPSVTVYSQKVSHGNGNLFKRAVHTTSLENNLLMAYKLDNATGIKGLLPSATTLYSNKENAKEVSINPMFATHLELDTDARGKLSLNIATDNGFSYELKKSLLDSNGRIKRGKYGEDNHTDIFRVFEDNIVGRKNVDLVEALKDGNAVYVKLSPEQYVYDPNTGKNVMIADSETHYAIIKTRKANNKTMAARKKANPYLKETNPDKYIDVFSVTYGRESEVRVDPTKDYVVDMTRTPNSAVLMSNELAYKNLDGSSVSLKDLENGIAARMKQDKATKEWGTGDLDVEGFEIEHTDGRAFWYSGIPTGETPTIEKPKRGIAIKKPTYTPFYSAKVSAKDEITNAIMKTTFEVGKITEINADKFANMDEIEKATTMSTVSSLLKTSDKNTAIFYTLDVEPYLADKEGNIYIKTALDDVVVVDAPIFYKNKEIAGKVVSIRDLAAHQKTYNNSSKLLLDSIQKEANRIINKKMERLDTSSMNEEQKSFLKDVVSASVWHSFERAYYTKRGDYTFSEYVNRILSGNEEYKNLSAKDKMTKQQADALFEMVGQPDAINIFLSPNKSGKTVQEVRASLIRKLSGKSFKEMNSLEFHDVIKDVKELSSLIDVAETIAPINMEKTSRRVIDWLSSQGKLSSDDPHKIESAIAKTRERELVNFVEDVYNIAMNDNITESVKKINTIEKLVDNVANTNILPERIVDTMKLATEEARPIIEKTINQLSAKMKLADAKNSLQTNQLLSNRKKYVASLASALAGDINTAKKSLKNIKIDKAETDAVFVAKVKSFQKFLDSKIIPNDLKPKIAEPILRTYKKITEQKLGDIDSNKIGKITERVIVSSLKGMSVFNESSKVC